MGSSKASGGGEVVTLTKKSLPNQTGTVFCLLLSVEASAFATSREEAAGTWLSTFLPPVSAHYHFKASLESRRTRLTAPESRLSSSQGTTPGS